MATLRLEFNEQDAKFMENMREAKTDNMISKCKSKTDGNGFIISFYITKNTTSYTVFIC